MIYRYINIICFSFFLISGAIGQSASCHNPDFDQAVQGIIDHRAPLLDVDSLKLNFEDYILIDSRRQSEYDVSHISGATLLHYKAEQEAIEQLPKDKKLLIYCSLGKRSETLAIRLNEAGFAAYNLYGGIFEWVNRGYPIVSWNDKSLQDEIVHTVHPFNPIFGKWILNKDIDTKGFILYD